MKKPKKTGGSLNSTPRKSGTKKPSPPRKKKTVKRSLGTARDCCAAFAAAASGSIVTVEDGVPVMIPPPTVASYLVIDPNGSGFPYWEPAPSMAMENL